MSSSSSTTDSSSSATDISDDDFKEFLAEREERFQLQGYQFQPTRYIDTDDSDLSDSNSSDSAANTRLQNSDWCTCEHCQIMDREVECVCCQEIPQIMDKNRKVSEEEHLNDPPITCVTNNARFKAVCLNRWVLEAAWYQYRQQYGSEVNYEGPEHKKNRHTAYRQLVRWCWGCSGQRDQGCLTIMCCDVHSCSFPTSWFRGRLRIHWFPLCR